MNIYKTKHRNIGLLLMLAVIVSFVTAGLVMPANAAVKEVGILTTDGTDKVTDTNQTTPGDATTTNRTTTNRTTTGPVGTTLTGDNANNSSNILGIVIAIIIAIAIILLIFLLVPKKKNNNIKK